MLAVAWVVVYLILVSPAWAQQEGDGGGTHAVPEIDPGSALSGLILLAGGVLLLVNSRRSKG
jgi:hypothetical protein